MESRWEEDGPAVNYSVGVTFPIFCLNVESLGWKLISTCACHKGAHSWVNFISSLKHICTVNLQDDATNRPTVPELYFTLRSSGLFEEIILLRRRVGAWQRPILMPLQLACPQHLLFQLRHKQHTNNHPSVPSLFLSLHTNTATPTSLNHMLIYKNKHGHKYVIKCTCKLNAFYTIQQYAY